ncbi:MAG: hypothetical protein OCC49_05725 [Fibrobacterales bacterium]
MHSKNYIYSFNFDDNEGDLCKLESRQVFNKEEKDKLLFSDIKVDPSCSAFIKKRLDILLFSEDYSTLIHDIKKECIRIEGFKVEYVVLDGDTTEYAERLKKLKDIGLSIEGFPDYYNPTIMYALSYYRGIWYFGVLFNNNFAWHAHKQKPCSYCNSIGMSVAKALVNIASQANKEKKLLDACCGVGTILLEACFAGYAIEGCDINEKICRDGQENLSHFNYTATINHCDIKDISNRYDAAIIDLPYNIFSHANDNSIQHIIESTAAITNRLVIVSTSDITNIMSTAGLKISDYCNVNKRGKTNFTRQIWVCEKNDSEKDGFDRATATICTIDSSGL